ncbi:MAG: N-acetylmuramoyl-L-alanine amidase [Elusimicrobia bacterium]|nr:N-acetylmuramoyl-L-alanine amidase [Elusimicrobiota bacterium]
MPRRVRWVVGMFLLLGPPELGWTQDVGESLRFQQRVPQAGPQGRVEPALPDRSRVPQAGAPPGTVVFETVASDPPVAAFNALLFHGILTTDRIEFQASIQTEDGTWSPWKKAYLKRHPNGRFWARVRWKQMHQAPVKLRAVSLGISGEWTLQVLDVEVFLHEEGDSSGSGLLPSLQSLPPSWILRDRWGAYPPREPYEPHVPDRITLHHTAGLQTFALEDSLAEVRWIQDFHQNGRGWNDIGYHFLVDGEGRVFQGRPVQAVGAHVKDGNAGNVGIALLGYFHAPVSDQPSELQLQGFIQAGRWVVRSFGAGSETLRGHRDYNPTACPGDFLYPRLEFLREQLHWDLIPSFDPTAFSFLLPK